MPSTNSVAHEDLIVCACGDKQYSTRDVIHAAQWRGDLQAHWTSFVKRLEAQKRADETDAEIDDSVIDAAAEAFRYEHDLITAEETEQWLAARGLSIDDFGDYFTRQYCGQAFGEEVAPQDIDYVSAPIELRQLFAGDLMFAGALDQLVLNLMWRLAAHRAAKDSDDKSVAAEEQRFFECHHLAPEQLPNWLNGLGRDSTWFGEMLALEADYRRRCETLLVPQSRQHELATLRLPLTRFETEVLELESRDAAQEALFCVREDGMSMDEVAAEGRYPYRQADFLLEDLPTDLQQKFVSVTPGEVLEPLARGDGFELVRIKRKIEPQADDPKIKLRIEQRLLDRHFSELASKHVERRLGAATAIE